MNIPYLQENVQYGILKQTTGYCSHRTLGVNSNDYCGCTGLTGLGSRFIFLIIVSIHGSKKGCNYFEDRICDPGYARGRYRAGSGSVSE